MPSALDLLKQNTSPTALQLLQQNTEKPNLPQASEADEGFLSNLWKGAKTGVAGTYGGIAGWVGGENAATQYFDDVVNSNRRSREYDGYSADYFTNGSGLAYDLGQLVGSIGSMAPAAFLPGVGAAGTAAARFVPGLLGRGLVRSAASKVGADAALSSAEKWAASKAGQNFLANAARYGAGSGGVESLSEGGSGVTEGFKNGDENPYLTGLEITAKNLPLLIASNTLEAATLGRGMMRFGGKAGESLAKRAALAVPRATPYAGVQALQQSGEEVAQQRIQEEAFNRPTGGILPSTWTPEEMKAFQDTFAAGGVMGLLGGLPGGFRRASSNPMQNSELDAAQQIINQAQQAQSVQNQAPIDSEPTAQPAMSVQEAQSRISQSAPTISAENSLDGFDSRFVSKWESKPGATDLAGVQPSVKNAFNAAIAEYGDGVTLTGGAEKGYHAAGETGHEGGWKIDVDKASVKDPQKFLQAMARHGFQVGDEGDHYDLSGHAKGGVGGTVVATPDSFVSDGGQSRGTGKREGHANAWAAYDVFRNAGYNDEAIAGILGRLQQEHNFDTSNVEEYDDAETGLHLGGYGMFQWNGGRTTAFLNWAQENNLDPQNPSVQAQYALIEAQQRGLTPERMNQLTAEEAADLWTDEWEVGKRGSERQYAAEWRDRIKNGGSAGGSTDIESPKTNIDTSEEDRAFDEYNKQLDELAEKGIEAPFKTEQPTQKELVQQAKESAIESGDMDEVQRINSAERSGNTEELAKIADKALKAKQKEVKGKPAPATPEIKMASPNLINQVKQLLNTAKEQGVKLDTNLLENTLKDGSEENLQNFAGMLQSMINAQGYENRLAQGKQLLEYADNNRIDLAPSLRAGLVKGYPKAIEAGQTVIDQANEQRQSQQNTPVAQPTISNQETVQPQTAPAPVQAQSAQNQPMQLQNGITPVQMTNAYNAAMAPMAETKEQRIKQSNAILTVARGAGVEIPQGMKSALREGSSVAIPKAQEIINNAGVTVPTAATTNNAEVEVQQPTSNMEKVAPQEPEQPTNQEKRQAENSSEEVQEKSVQKQGNGENVDNSGDKSVNDERKELIDRVMQGYHDGKKSLDDAKVELKHYRDRFAGMAKAKGKYKPTPEVLRTLNEAVGYADQQLNELATISKENSDNELSQQDNGGKIEVETEESSKPENKLQRMRRGRDELEAVVRKYEDGEITQSEAYSQVSKIAKDIATVPKEGVPNATFIDGKMKQELTDYGDRLIDEAAEAAEKSEAEKRKFKEISDILSKYEKGEKNLIPIEDFMKQVHSLKTLSKEQMQALDERAAKIAEKDSKEVVENEQQGESGSPAGGHEGVRTEKGEGNQRGVAGEVFGQNGREGTQVNGSGKEEDAAGLGQPAGVREGTELEETAGARTDKRGNQPTVPLTEAEANPSPTEIPGNDYEIKDTDQSTKSEKVRFKQNVDAIKLLKQLEEDDRMPTPAEQEVLAAYNGWDGLKNAFLDGKEMNKELRDLLTDEEYKAAQSTINDAFYTPPKLIRAIWEGISHLGFKGGRVLDPSMGVGNFFGAMPRDMMENSALRGVELDNLTSRFAKMLYPSVFVENKGFQKASVADNYFDLAISNIPFGQNMINGYQVHNYFFANGIDKVRPGGLMVYITSQGSLAGGKDAAKMRNYLENQADLIAAYKLPSGVFSDAGTQVATDIVIFRKRDKDGKKSPYGQKFGDVKEIKTGNWYHAPSYGINEYFVAHPENILGEQSTGRDQWGNTALNVKMAEGASVADVADDLRSAMQKLPDNVYQPVSRKKSKSFDTASAQKKANADEKTRDYEYYYKDGKPVQNQSGQEVELTGHKAKVVNDYLKVKNTLNALFAAESDPKAKEKDVEGLRKKLNKDYDAFVAKHGSLTGTAAKNYADDPSAGMVQALEKPVKDGKKKGKVEKADIFTTRSIKAVQEVTHVETADDALIASLTNHGTVDLDYMAELTNSKPETLVSKLKGKLFKNPVTLDYETRDEYLSGNVRQKLAQAKEAAKVDKAYEGNVKELEKVIPEDLVSDEIFVNLGTPWIPVQDVQAFVDTLADNVRVSFSRGAALWTVSGYGRSAKYKLKGIDFPSLLNHVLNNKAIQIYDGSGDNKVFNQEKTDAANVAAEELQQDFKDWIWKDKDREKRLVKYYNDNYNNTVVRQYDGQHLNLHSYGMNAKIELKPHQKDVVWRMLQSGNTLIAHCVGAGKTFEMQAAGMEMRRLGIANKPMYCLPNNVVEQFAREFRQLYPNAKLLVLQSNDLPAVEKTSKMEKTEDGRKKRVSLLEGKSPEQVAKIMEKRTARNRMLNRIRTEDWDGIIISHNLFQRFPVTPETAADFIQQEIDTLEQTIREAKQDRMDSRALSNLETSKKNLQERLEEVISTDIEDIGVPFEELGIDQLFVDEADMFKNLAFATRLGNIRGLSNSKANRSQDMFLKTQWLTNNMGGRGVVFATGTPVSNTMSELYTMMRYLDMKGLKEKGLEVFDNWMRTFGDIGQGIERKPTGDGFRKVTMIKRFINMAELTKMFRSFADVKVQDELNLNIPKLKNDKSTVIALEPDAKVVNYIKKVVPERVKKMKSGFKKEKGEDNMLSLTNDLRKLSLTDSKIEACADAIAKKYHETTDVKGTQLVFCDMGIPKAESDKASGEETATTFDVESPEVYRTLIAKLKEKGIPDKDVAFIQNYNTKTKRDNVFQKVNEGEVRILIGSTETMGAGTNCQKHLVALHDLDAPWRPRDLEQRHGRILRQGNENKQVEIFNYVVKDSFDANMWEKLKNKAAIIQQAMSGDMNLRTVEDSDLVTLSYAEVEGAATGNPLIKEQLQVQNDLTKYQHAQTAFRKKVRDAENTLAGSEEKIAEQEKVIAKIEKDIAQRKDTKGDKFSMLINGKAYKDRTKADEALAGILKNYKQQKSMDIGQIGGFRLSALYKPAEDNVLLQVVNNRAYKVQTNSVAGIENTLRNAPEKALEFRQGDLNEYKKNVAQAQEIVQQENPYAEKVKQLSDRLNQLNREIADTLVDDGKQKVAQAEDTSIDSEPETEVKEPAKEEKPVVKETLTTESTPKAPVSDRIIVGTVPPAGKSTANVNVDEFEHTKTGKMIPAASLKDHVDKDFRKQATTIAKNHGGKWSPFAKRILFKTEQGRDDFVREVEALLSANEGKASVEGEIARAVRNAKVVDNADLTSQQRKMSEFGEQIGTPILWISADPKLHGYHAPNGTTVLNVRSNMDLSKTFWHEAFHWVAGNNEALYNELLDYFKGKSAFSPKQLEAYRKRIVRPGMSDELTIEEMLADNFEEVKDRVKIFKEMGAEQPSLARKFVAWVKRIMDKFAEVFHNPEGKLTTAQRDSFVKAFGRLARDMKDGEGRPLFKVYKEGKEIRLTNGQLVTEGIKLSAKNDIDKEGQVRDNVGKKYSYGNHIAPENNEVNNEITLSEDGRKITSIELGLEISDDETETERIERRKKEIRALDKQISRMEGNKAFVNLVPDINKAQIDTRLSKGETGQELIEQYQAQYHEELSKYSETMSEERRIERALILKGAAYYVAEKSNISYDEERSGGIFDGGYEQSRGRDRKEARAGEKGIEQVTTKHSGKGAFSYGKTKYSYSASDNSNEGLFHKIKNIMSGKASEDSEKFRYRKHLTEMIEKALDVKLRYGKMDGKKDVVYKPENRVLRSRHAFDWENILPVAGRIAAEQLEIEPTESMNNYIADWILTGAPNNVSKEADTFHKAMRQHPADSAKLEDLRDAFAEWLGKDYREQMQGTIQWKNKQKPTMQERKNKFYEEFVEELEPINRMVKQVNANLTEKGQSKLGVSADPMIAFRMLRGSYGRAMTALEGVNDGAVEALKHAFPNVDFTGFKTLYQILKSIDAFQNAEKQRDFVTYCTACHIMDMHQHNDDIRQEQQHLKNKIEKLGTSKEDEKQKAEYEKDIEKLSNEVMPIPAAYSKDNCQKYINDGYDKYHDAQQDLVHFSNTTAAMLADSGVISEKRFKELLTKWQNYVPLFRVFEDNEDINFGDSMKHIKGSTRDIVNPLESIIRNTAQFIQKAELNKAKCLLADVARCDASGWLLEEVDKSDSDKTTITFWENGQRKYLQTDPDIVRAVNNMGADGSHFFIKFLHAITRLARACFTMASPEFALRNVARDWQDATLYTKHGMWVNPLDIVRGFIHAWKKDDVFYEWLTQGAAQASALSLDRDYTQSTLDKLGRGYWKRLASKDFHHALLEGLQMAGEYSEYGTRIAMYQKTKAAILKDKPNATKQELHEAMLEAAFESRDLMDFARHGKAGAEYNKITAFANASIQGWDKLYRSLDFKNDPKRATRVAAKLVLYGALPAMMIFAMYHDDDWYKDAPNWLKETHWLFKFGDTTIRIPKAADMGIRFISNAVEKGLDEAYNKHPHKAKEYFLPMWDALPGMLPTSILPIIEIQANHSFFTDRPIIPQGQDKLPAKLQYGPYTTSLAKWIGETFDIAPRSVEHFISGYTGTLGMAIPKAIDLVSGQNQQSLSLEEMPLIRGYLYPQFKSPQSVNDFYNALDEQTKLKNEYKLTKKRPDGFDPAKLQRLENAQKQMRKISKQEKSIIDNPKWSIKDKEVMQRNIQKKRIEIAKRALGRN